MEPKSIQSHGKVMVYLSFCPVLEAEVGAETMKYCFKEDLVAEVEAVVEPLLYTLMLKKLMIILRTATY